MNEPEHQPTVADAVDDVDQPGEALDAEKVPEEFPERPVASLDYGTTEEEMAHDEPLDKRLAREQPDFGEVVDHDATTTATPLLDDADDQGYDEEKDLVADTALTEPEIEDSAHPDAPPSAEEAAVRVEESDDVPGAVDHEVVYGDDEEDPRRT